MDFDGFAGLTWREGLLALIVVLALYVVVVFLRYQRVQREKLEADASSPFATRSALAAYVAEQAPAPPETLPPEPALPPEPEPAPSFAWNEPPEAQHEAVAEPLAELQYDVAQLRKEVGALRAELLTLREERRRDETKTQVTENVAPVYSDAMQMAIQGHEAAAISQHCGISRAEAELVVALVRNRDS